jgi:hypothetical protein
VRAGAGDGGEVRGSKEGNRAGIGERTTRGRRRSRRWSGGGRAAARGALHRQQEKQSRAARARGRRREGRGSGRPVWKFQEFQGPLGKERFPTDVGV